MLIAQLKFFSLFKISFFDRFKFNYSSSIFVEENINKIRSYALKKMIDKRFTVRRKSKYLIEWKKYNFKKNIWRSLFKIKNAMNLIKKYEKIIKDITYFSKHLNFIAIDFFVFKLMKSSASSLKVSIIEMIFRNSQVIILIKISSANSFLFSRKISSIDSFSFLWKTFASLRRFSRLLLSLP